MLALIILRYRIAHAWKHSGRPHGQPFVRAYVMAIDRGPGPSWPRRPTAAELAMSPKERVEQLEAERRQEILQAGGTIKDASPIHCVPEATLYRNREGRAMTAWRYRTPGGRVRVIYESGFRAEPSSFGFPSEPGWVPVMVDEFLALGAG